LGNATSVVSPGKRGLFRELYVFAGGWAVKNLRLPRLFEWVVGFFFPAIVGGDR